MSRRSAPANLSIGILSINNVCAYLSMSPQSVRNLIKSGLIKSIKFEGMKDHRIPVHSLIAFMEAYNLTVPNELRESARNNINLLDDTNKTTDPQINFPVESTPRKETFSVISARAGAENTIVAAGIPTMEIADICAHALNSRCTDGSTYIVSSNHPNPNFKHDKPTNLSYDLTSHADISLTPIDYSK